MKSPLHTKTILDRIRLALSDRRLPTRRLLSATAQIKEMQGIFLDRCDYSQLEHIHDHPLICLGFTNRSGSNLLGSYLRKCPPFAGFREDLNPSTIGLHARRLKAVSLPETIRLLSAEQRKEHKIYGFKTSVEQLIMLQRFSIGRMYSGGIRLIEIRRDDIIAQAISYHIALQTGRWTSRTKPNTDVTPTCDPLQIERLVTSIRASQILMDFVVERDAIDRIIVHYEDLVDDPSNQVKKIARFCGFDPTSWSMMRPEIARQTNATNEAFRAQFRHHIAARSS